MTDRGITCAYVARKENPSNWHGEKPDDWELDRWQPTGVEQELWECPHDALSDRRYCAFHTQPDDLPTEIDEGELFVKAINESNSTENDVARHKKEFVGATFGPFDIREATLDAGDDHPIRLDHATFTAGIRADAAVFRQGLFAQAASFGTSSLDVSNHTQVVLSFTNAEFNSDRDIRFGRAEFNGDGRLSFDHAKFNGNGQVSFAYTKFNGNGDLSFFETEFNGDGHLSFGQAEFNGDGRLWFDDAKFNGDGDLSFVGTKFNGDGNLSFYQAEFNGNGNLSFRHAEFSGDSSLSFVGTKFNGDGSLWFNSTEFNSSDSLWFNSTEFNGNGDISVERAEMGRPCIFRDVRFKSAKQVTFTGADIRESLIFENDLEGKEIREFRVSFDFSDAVISDELRFRDSGYSAVQKPSGDETNEQERFDLIFVEPVDFSGTTFGKPADFSSTQFLAEADFSGAIFEEPADFSSTQFLAEVDFRHTRVQSIDFHSADLVGPENKSSTKFDNADLSGVNFSNANVTGASFERAVLNRAELLGANLTRTKLYGALLGDARFNRETKFWLSHDATDRVPDDSLLPVRVLRAIKAKLRRVSRRDGSEPYCVYDPRYRGANGETNLEKAAEVYGSLETLARQQSQPELASDCFLGRKDIQLKQYRKDHNWLMIARSMVPNVVARYGESPLRVLGTAAATIFACGLAYYSFGLIEHTGTEEPATLFESLYFSALTFTTLGYGDFNPITTGGQVLTVAETSMGVILLAILVFVFGRRATR